MVVTCGNMLKLPSLEKMKVVAGEKGLNRIIRWVHVMEYPEYSKWLNGGELILFSGVSIENDVDKFINFVRDINSKNVSGLAVNIGPYIKKTPKEVIELANSLGFPIFEFPFQMKFIDVSQSICKQFL
ncbi:PucR family transcriptional regulator ligand-binding domain-containing protein [Clostridium sp. DMHC 10]|uniref:PucR family transcriptional regulator ligand-binding domain-containing protein n=1 Tax=Clostridium sp. DMHC 10 TaxID=747377 RepID=UPI000A735EAC|nr:PucR family transcriptional regulator ligand-binding domain-containing protein [Clostridium sp. DMHC 10]